MAMLRQPDWQPTQSEQKSISTNRAPEGVNQWRFSRFVPVLLLHDFRHLAEKADSRQQICSESSFLGERDLGIAESVVLNEFPAARPEPFQSGINRVQNRRQCLMGEHFFVVDVSGSRDPIESSKVPAAAQPDGREKGEPMEAAALHGRNSRRFAGLRRRLSRGAWLFASCCRGFSRFGYSFNHGWQFQLGLFRSAMVAMV
jgi:hypothetical protein